MSKNKTKFSTCVVYNKKGQIAFYLSRKDEEQGKDIAFDLQGYKVVAL